MRRCAKCGLEKDDKEFNKKKGERLHSYCRPCLYQFQKERWLNRKKKAVESCGGKCSKCGYDKNYAALSFHHVNPDDKERDWNKLRLVSKEKLQNELDKCIVICHNCHSELHYPQLNKR